MTAGTIESDKDIGNSLPLELGDASQGVVVCFHRKMMPQEFYFLSGDKYSPSLFGIPLVIVIGAGKTTSSGPSSEIGVTSTAARSTTYWKPRKGL